MPTLLERLRTALGGKEEPKVYKVPKNASVALQEAYYILWNTYGYREDANFPGDAYIAAVRKYSGQGLIGDKEYGFSRILNEDSNDGLRHYIGFVADVPHPDNAVKDFKVAEFRMRNPGTRFGDDLGYPKNISLSNFLTQLNAGKTPVEIFDAVQFPVRVCGKRLDEARLPGARVEGYSQ